MNPSLEQRRNKMDTKEFNTHLVNQGIYPPIFWENVIALDEVYLVTQKIKAIQNETDFKNIVEEYV